MKPEQCVLSHSLFRFLVRSFALVFALSLSPLFFHSLFLSLSLSLSRFFALSLASTCKQKQSLTLLASKVATVQHMVGDDDVNNDNNDNNVS